MLALTLGLLDLVLILFIVAAVVCFCASILFRRRDGATAHAHGRDYD